MKRVFLLLASFLLSLHAQADSKCDRYALELFRDLAATEQGNIVFSPASLESTLHLLRQGAAGETQAALESLPLGRQGVASAMRVDSSTSLFVKDGLRLRKLFFEQHHAPFVTNRTLAAKKINDWAREKTHALVPELIHPEAIPPLTQMVILDVVYLHEQWLCPFDKYATGPGCFLTADGRQLSVPLMRQTSGFHHATGADWEAVAMFYRHEGRRGEPGCFIGILPKGDAREFAKNLTAERFDAIRRALSAAPIQKLRLTLPRMRLDSGDRSLKPLLCRHGLSRLFGGEADFRAFFEAPSPATDIYLEDVFQSCRVIVSEDGTQAAATTMAIARTKSLPLTVEFTRPFIWVIGDLTTDAPPHFIGLCEAPCQ